MARHVVLVAEHPLAARASDLQLIGVRAKVMLLPILVLGERLAAPFCWTDESRSLLGVGEHVQF